MKKFLLLPVVLAVGFGILVLISSGSDDKDKGKEGEEITTKSGLKITDLKVGDGKEAKAGDTVVVHYTGWLKDGTKFDSSHDSPGDKPAPLTLKSGPGGVIKGWVEGIPGMKVGGKRKLIIPPELGYGPEGTPGGPIPPDAELTFEIELFDVK
jgi:FKBP-type peptidyl-prolyl cis-trans isomerase FkpA